MESPSTSDASFSNSIGAVTAPITTPSAFLTGSAPNTTSLPVSRPRTG
jgi:hypothetical protein